MMCEEFLEAALSFQEAIVAGVDDTVVPFQSVLKRLAADIA